MEEFVSETVKIRHGAEPVFRFMEDMSLLAHAVSNVRMPEIEDFQCSRDACSFKVKGMETGLQIVEREPFKTIKYTGCGAVPFEFFAWLQLKELAPDDTRMRMVVRAKMNFVTKMMFKGKIKNGLDGLVAHLAEALNR
jgi:carbon monoxide dehydrogenase subunit G